MRLRLLSTLSLALLCCSLIGCGAGGGGIQEGAPPEDLGYVEPTEVAE